VKTRLAGPARQQATNFHRWWRKNRPASPDLFARELEAARKFIANTPELGTVYVERHGTVVRRVLMPKTENHVYYEIDREKGIAIILAIWGAPKERGPKL
jgi:plasmid stabilization system protein ParE